MFMKVIRSIPSLRQQIARARQSGKIIGFVPTMGALHAGHLSLIHRARKAVGPKGLVVVSIFVNPTQFNQKSDLIKYPRQLAVDQAMCRTAGVDVIFAPLVKSIYPPHFSTWVEEIELSQSLCGASRPGHFRGVCTIVLKLFNLVQPQIAVFGRKDFQQAQIISRMVRDFHIPVKILIASTMREVDGLAMSSRNQRLSIVERERAPALYEALKLIRSAFRSGTKEVAALKRIAARHFIKTPSLRIDYFEIVDSFTLQTVSHCSKGDVVVIAAYLGKIRLIDNLRL